MGDRKLTGCCSLCDEPIFEVVERYTDGPYKGEIKQVGRPLPDARRVTLVRVSGRTSYLSMCGECEVAPDNIAQLNKKEVAAMAYERNIVRRGSLEQEEYREKLLRVFEFDIPLGVLGETPWVEVR